jgi:hypothetical protein
MKKPSTDEFYRIQEQLKSLHEEIDKLSKKKPDDAINKFKLGFINELLAKANEALDDAYYPFADFRSFDVDNVPTNSDVVMILAQYIASFKRQEIVNNRSDTHFSF